jgi:hypothetical protein
MKATACHLALLALLFGTAPVPVQGRQPDKGGLSELEQYKQLKKLKDEEKKRRQEEVRKESNELLRRFTSTTKVVILLKYKLGKESEIEGYVGGVVEHLDQKFLRVRDSMGGTIALVQGSAILAIKRKE